jgi:hypothetical protein
LNALAALAVTTAVVTAAQPAVPETAILFDSDSPVASTELVDRLRDAALAGFEARPALTLFQLTARSVTEIPGQAPDTLRALHFESPSSTYSGISLSVNEAFEILRRNEPVREDVIRRACGPQRERDCGGAVHAAAAALVKDVDAGTTRKIRLLVEFARATRARSLVLMTAGWPYRDTPPRVDETVRVLQASGVSLVVWRLKSNVAYTGLVRDAVAVIATRLQAPVIEIDDESAARQAGAAQLRVNAPETPAREPESLPPAAIPSRVEEDERAADVADATLRQAAAYVRRFEETFAAVIWHERYQQEAHTQLKFNASGGRFSTLAGRRLLESELLLLWLPNESNWIAVRDVVTVDGVARPAADRRVQRALGNASVSVDQLKQLAAENGRYNIGQIVRTFNEPTLALLLLDSHYRHRFSFKRGKRETIGGRRAVTYDFIERARPTLIQDRRRDVPARGTLWIDEAAGQVLQTTLALQHEAGRLQGQMTVRYDAHRQFSVLVPVEMRETYASSGEEINAIATYSNFRRFETAGRLIITP